MNLVKNGEAVVVSIDPTDDGFNEVPIDEVKQNSMKLVMGYLREKQENQYFVDILNNWFGIYGTIKVKKSSIGIPVEANVQNSFGIKVKAYGAVIWDADFNKELKAITDLGVKMVKPGDLKRITSWDSAEQKNSGDAKKRRT